MMNNYLFETCRWLIKWNKLLRNSWFQTLAVFWMLYAFFLVIPRRLEFICRRFGTLCLFHLHRRIGMNILHTYPPMKMEQTDYSETSAYEIQTPGELPRRKHTILKNYWILLVFLKYLRSLISLHRVRRECDRTTTGWCQLLHLVNRQYTFHRNQFSFFCGTTAHLGPRLSHCWGL